ncbi:MAG TPA: nodulation protein NfeD [Bryobacteraceae bacterium]|nr:nodulation protein NfeD [Bryobacteraceae bacterium]
MTATFAAAADRVITIDVDGVVHPITVEMIGHAIDQARAEKAAALLIRLNTPGGLAESTRQITEKIVASPVPVVTYVAPSGGRAASAGFYILQAGDIAAMAPGTNTGAATPVLLGQQVDPVMRNKINNDAAAALRSIVSKRGRNAELAEKTVLESKSFTDKEALDNRLIEFIASDERDLFTKIASHDISRFDGRKQSLRVASPEFVAYERTLRERLVGAIADPNIALILLVIGALGIYVEFSAPGLIAPGVLGSIMVLMGLSALSVLPINLAGVALLILAFVLFILEAKFASHGILGIGGAVAMVLGALLLIDSPAPEMRIRLATAIGLAVPFALITIFLVSLVLRARANKVVTGVSGMLDSIGVARTAVAPHGKVFVNGEYWDAVSAVPIAEGARVRVTRVDGLTLEVEPVAVAGAGRPA